MIDNFTSLWKNESAADSGNSSDINLSLSSEFECSIDALPGIVTNIVIAVLYSLVCIAGIFGNSLVIFVVIKFRWFMSATPRLPQKSLSLSWFFFSLTLIKVKCKRLPTITSCKCEWFLQLTLTSCICCIFQESRYSRSMFPHRDSLLIIHNVLW